MYLHALEFQTYYKLNQLKKKKLKRNVMLNYLIN